MSDQPDAYLTWLWKRVAAWHAIADSMGMAGRAMSEVELALAPIAGQRGLAADALADMMRQTEAGRQHARLAGEVDAAQARAYEDMMHSGGPQDSEAYHKYREATQWQVALLPGTGVRHEPGGLVG